MGARSRILLADDPLAMLVNTSDILKNSATLWLR